MVMDEPRLLFERHDEEQSYCLRNRYVAQSAPMMSVRFLLLIIVPLIVQVSHSNKMSAQYDPLAEPGRLLEAYMETSISLNSHVLIWVLKRRRY